MLSKGIKHGFTASYTPQPNGRAERELRKIVDATLSIICARDVNDENI